MISILSLQLLSKSMPDARKRAMHARKSQNFRKSLVSRTACKLFGVYLGILYSCSTKP